MTKYCLNLNDNIARSNQELIGNKAYNLAKFFDMTNIPRGFIVTTRAYDSYMKILLKKDIFKYSKMYVDGKLSKHNYLAKISTCFKDVALESSIQDEILKFAKHLQSPLVIRSSATCEDSHTMSFAGIFDTFLNVKTQDINSFVGKVFASIFNPRAVKYAIENGMDISKIKMACIIQEMVSEAKFGVGFFFEEDGSRYHVIEAAVNDPSGITAGSKSHDTYIKNVKSDEIIRYKSESSKSTLFDFEIEDIITLMKTVGNELFPLDLEWAYSRDGPILLQARILTTTIPIKYNNQSFGCLPISSGKCSGEAVIFNSAKINDLPKGNDKILVAGELPIEDSNIIKRYGGVIIELAGITSHVAILAREYKVPCIAGLDRATEIIKPSEHIQIDGTAGTVTLLDRKGIVVNKMFKAVYAKPENFSLFKMKNDVLIVEKNNNEIILHYDPLIHKEIRNNVINIQNKFRKPVLTGAADVWQRYWMLLEVCEYDKKIKNYLYKATEAIKSFDINEIDLMVNNLLKFSSISYKKSELALKHHKKGEFKFLIAALYHSYYAFAYWNIACNAMLRDGIENALIDETNAQKLLKMKAYIFKINLDETHPIHRIGDEIVNLIGEVYNAMRTDGRKIPESFSEIKFCTNNFLLLDRTNLKK